VLAKKLDGVASSKSQNNYRYFLLSLQPSSLQRWKHFKYWTTFLVLTKIGFFFATKSKTLDDIWTVDNKPAWHNVYLDFFPQYVSNRQVYICSLNIFKL